MTLVVSTRCTYASHMGLPELPGGQSAVIPDSLLHIALSLPGVLEVPSSPPEEELVFTTDLLPETSWESDPFHHELTFKETAP